MKSINSIVMSNVTVGQKLDDDKMLGRFMGWKFVESDSEFITGQGYWADKEENWICDDGELLFGVDWNSLHELVGRIGNIVKKGSPELIDKVTEYRELNKDNLFDCSMFSDIEYVYECCVSFVKFYNHITGIDKGK